MTAGTFGAAVAFGATGIAEASGRLLASVTDVFGTRPADWVVAAIVLLVLIGWLLSYTATRLDRLHTRLEGTWAALDAQLVRRAEAVLELANSGALDAATSLILAAAAAEAAEATGEESIDREQTESDLTETLNQALTTEVVEHVRAVSEDGAEALDRVLAAGRRVQIARRFHNDAVTDVRRVHRQRLVRLFRLAGHTPMPRTVEFDDRLP